MGKHGKWSRSLDNPKIHSLKLKADADTLHKLIEYSERLNISRAEVLRRGVHRLYHDLDKQ